MPNKHTDSADSLSAKQYILNDDPRKIKKALQERIAQGKKLLFEFGSRRKETLSAKFIRSFAYQINKWDTYNETLLKTTFTDPEITKNYRSTYGIPFKIDPTLTEWADDVEKHTVIKIGRLESLVEQMPFFDMASKSNVTRPTALTNFGNKVFIVHGHDETTKLLVARLLEHLEIKPIIIHEKVDQSRTIIEKLEEESKDAGYAIVLLTPDDEGKSRENSSTLKARARQNVILELGFFISKLGRKNVCALYVEGVELPSDFDGVLYTLVDSAGAWQTKLAKELKAAHFNIDLNKLP